MREVTKVVYQADDGTVFSKKEECIEYEGIVKNIKVYPVLYGTDTTEGRYELSKTGLAICLGKDNESGKNALEWLCYKNLGSQYEYVQGKYLMGYEMKMWDILPPPMLLCVCKRTLWGCPSFI